MTGQPEDQERTTKKVQIIAGLIEARKRILDVATALNPTQHDEVFLGVWSVKDLLAHLVGWDYTNIEAVKEIRAGHNPSCFAQWNPNWAAYNARLVEQYKRDDVTDLLTALDQSHRALMDYLESVYTDDFERDFGVRSPRGRVMTVAYHLQAQIEDEREHYEQIKTFRAGQIA